MLAVIKLEFVLNPKFEDIMAGKHRWYNGFLKNKFSRFCLHLQSYP